MVTKTKIPPTHAAMAISDRRVGRYPLRLKAEKQSEEPIGKLQNDAAVVEHGIVAGVLADIALIHVNVVNPVQAVGVPKLGIDGFVQVLFELCAERIELTSSVLALIKVQRQQVLQVVTAGAAGRRQHPSQLPVE